MDKIYYKELIEKYFDGNITDAEIKELSDWIKNDRHLQNWWEEEFSKSDAGINPVLRDKLFARIKEQTQGKEETQGKEKPRTIRMNPWKWAAAIVLPICIAFFTYYLVDSSQTVGAPFTYELLPNGFSNTERGRLPSPIREVVSQCIRWRFKT